MYLLLVARTVHFTPIHMTRRSAFLFALCTAIACAPRTPDAGALDVIAKRYVVLALQFGRHDANYVDAYYGPDSLKTAAQAESLSVPRIRAIADSLLASLGDSTPAYADSMVRNRHRYLRSQLSSLSARARIVGGEKLLFDDEARALYGATPPHYADAHFDSLLAKLELLLPGKGTLAQRYDAFHTRVMIPKALVDTVFKTAIAACRERTKKHITLPAEERFDLEYVKGTSWNAYNWYKGGYKSLIQVNLDFPIPVERAVDLACHEGYPGHHVYNALIEKTLVHDRGWVEYSVYPLFSPQSLIAEGSGNAGIDMAFPGAERTAFERDVLFPLAKLDTSLAQRNADVRVIFEKLNYARNEVARRYLNGELDRAAAEAAMQRYWLSTPEAAAKTLRFIDTYRSYVINYNYGRDMVTDWVVRAGGNTHDEQWRAFGALLSSPGIPGDLTKAK
ncbi:MAG: hypothetical protein V4550_14200 [Gemmatimonadota bacterium]